MPRPQLDVMNCFLVSWANFSDITLQLLIMLYINRVTTSEDGKDPTGEGKEEFKHKSKMQEEEEILHASLVSSSLIVMKSLQLISVDAVLLGIEGHF